MGTGPHLAMRQIVLDTETTGLEIEQGHRVIEIACIETINRTATGRTLHRYVNPGIEIDSKALEVHGITNEFLELKPPFSEIADELIEFVRGADLIIHNAEFDVGFLNNELAIADKGYDPIEKLCSEIIDTLRIAQDLRPGRRNNLDALATEYGVDLSDRSKHGALVDAEILLRIYKAMTGGQTAMEFEESQSQAGVPGSQRGSRESFAGIELPVLRASDEELKAHEQWLDYLDSQCGGKSVWRQIEAKS